METCTATRGDANARLATAQDPQTESQVLWQMIEDPNPLIANTARTRLGLRPTTVPDIMHVPDIDPTAGRAAA